MRSQVLRNLVVVTSLAAVYTIAGKLGLMLAFVHASATAVWPPAGIALAAFLVLGYRVWFGIFLGAFLVNITTAGSVATSIGIATGNTLEGLVGAYLVNSFANGRHAFERPHDIFKFAVLASMVSTTVSATIGVTSLALGSFADWANYGAIWLTWWLGDAGGALIVAPLLLLWSANPRVQWSRAQVFEGALLLTLLFLVGEAVFGGWLPPDAQNYPFDYLCVPILLWAAFRFGQRETATATFLLSGIAIWGTLQGFGPFVRGTQHESLLLLQAFMGTTALMAMAFAAVVSEHKRAEETNARLAAIVESSDDGIISKTLDGIVTSWNKGAERIFGYTAEEIIGKPGKVLIPSGRVNEELEIIERLKRDEHIEVYEYEMVRRRKDGEEIDVSLTISPIRDNEGRIIGASKIVRDITARKRAENQFRQAVESSPSGMLMVDQSGKIVLVNEQVEKQFGYSRKELIGQPMEILIPERYRAQHPEHRARFFVAPAARLMGKGRDLCGRRKDGSEFQVEIGLNPIRTAEGVRVLASVVDISERKRAEHALRESEARLQLVMGQLPAIIWITDTKLRITFVKGAGLRPLELDPNQLVGTTVPEHFQDDPQRAPLTTHEVALRGEPCSCEMKIRGRWLQAYIEPLRTPDGIITGCLGIALDITWRKQAEEGREKLIRALQDALDNIKTLRGLLPICAACNKIRDSQGQWDKIETYIQQHTEAHFTHSICPECMSELYPKLGSKKAAGDLTALSGRPRVNSQRVDVSRGSRMDKRQHLRVRAQFRSHFSAKCQMVAGEGELRDLSPSGCRVMSPIAVPVGVELELYFPGDEANPLVIDGASVRWARAQEFGCAFTQIPPEAQRQLGQLCMKLASG